MSDSRRRIAAQERKQRDAERAKRERERRAKEGLPAAPIPNRQKPQITPTVEDQPQRSDIIEGLIYDGVFQFRYFPPTDTEKPRLEIIRKNTDRTIAEKMIRNKDSIPAASSAIAIDSAEKLFVKHRKALFSIMGMDIADEKSDPLPGCYRRVAGYRRLEEAIYHFLQHAKSISTYDFDPKTTKMTETGETIPVEPEDSTLLAALEAARVDLVQKIHERNIAKGKNASNNKPPKKNRITSYSDRTPFNDEDGGFHLIATTTQKGKSFYEKTQPGPLNITESISSKLIALLLGKNRTGVSEPLYDENGMRRAIASEAVPGWHNLKSVFDQRKTTNLTPQGLNEKVIAGGCGRSEVANLVFCNADGHYRNQGFNKDEEMSLIDFGQCAFQHTSIYAGIKADRERKGDVAPKDMFPINREDIESLPAFTHTKPYFNLQSEYTDLMTKGRLALNHIAKDPRTLQDKWSAFLDYLLISDEIYDLLLAPMTSTKKRAIYRADYIARREEYKKILLTIPEFCFFVLANPQLITETQARFTEVEAKIDATKIATNHNALVTEIRTQLPTLMQQHSSKAQLLYSPPAMRIWKDFVAKFKDLDNSSPELCPIISLAKKADQCQAHHFKYCQQIKLIINKCRSNLAANNTFGKMVSSFFPCFRNPSASKETEYTQLLYRAMTEYDLNIRFNPQIQTIEELLIAQQKREMIADIDKELNRLAGTYANFCWFTSSSPKKDAYLTLKHALENSPRTQSGAEIIAKPLGITATLDDKKPPCPLVIINQEPQDLTDVKGITNIGYVWVQPNPNKLPTALYFVNKSHPTTPLKKMNLDNEKIAALMKKLYPDVDNHQYKDKAQLATKQLRDISFYTGHAYPTWQDPVTKQNMSVQDILLTQRGPLEITAATSATMITKMQSLPNPRDLMKTLSTQKRDSQKKSHDSDEHPLEEPTPTGGSSSPSRSRRLSQGSSTGSK